MARTKKTSKSYTGFDKFAVQWANAIMKFRWLAMAAVILTVMATAFGAKNLGFSTNYRVFFSDANPQLQAFESLENTYTSVDNIAFVLKAKDGDIFKPQYLEAVQWLTEEAWKIPYTARVDSISNFQHTYAEGDEMIVIDLVDGEPSTFTNEQVAYTKKTALAEPLIRDRLINQKGDTTAVVVTTRLSREDPMEVPQTAAAARELFAEFQEKYPYFETALSGAVMMNNQFMESSMQDMKVLQNIMYIVIAIALLVFLRSISGTIVTFIVMMGATASAMGMAGWLGIPLTPPSATAPTIILTLAIADSVHILVSLFKNLRSGMDKYDAIQDAVRINLQPVILTSITTIIGFLTLNMLDTPPFGHMGNITAMGVFAALAYSVIFLPAFMSLMPLKASVNTNVREASPIMQSLSNFVVKQRTKLLIGVGSISVFLVVLIPTIEINDQFVQYFDKSVQFRTDTEFMIENLSGIYTAEYSLTAEEAGGVSEPAYLNYMEEFANWLRIQPEVQHVYAMTDIFKRLNKNMHADDESYYRIPQNRDLAAQYLLLYEMSLPYGLDLNDRINVDKSASRLTATMYDVSTKDMKAFLQRSRDWQTENLPSYMVAEPTSPIVMFTYISERNIRSMLRGNTVALILISILIGFALRSFKFGLFSLLPNLLPIGTAFGIWALLSGQVNMAAASVSAVALGIVVDDTVHFLSKYMRARREHGYDAVQATHYAFTTVGTALVVTTVTLVFGFGVLSFSTFALNQVMGVLTAIAIACALIADFLLLPPALMLMDKLTKNKTASTEEKTHAKAA